MVFYVFFFLLRVIVWLPQIRKQNVQPRLLYNAGIGVNMATEVDYGIFFLQKLDLANDMLECNPARQRMKTS